MIDWVLLLAVLMAPSGIRILMAGAARADGGGGAINILIIMSLSLKASS